MPGRTSGLATALPGHSGIDPLATSQQSLDGIQCSQAHVPARCSPTCRNGPCPWRRAPSLAWRQLHLRAWSSELRPPPMRLFWSPRRGIRVGRHAGSCDGSTASRQPVVHRRRNPASTRHVVLVCSPSGFSPAAIWAPCLFRLYWRPQSGRSGSRPCGLRVLPPRHWQVELSCGVTGLSSGVRGSKRNRWT